MKERLAVPAGSLILGGTAYAFLILAARTLDPAAYAPLAALWALVFAVAPAVFMPLEQEVARHLARDDAAAPATRSLLVAGAGSALVCVGITCALALPALSDLQEHGFDGSTLLLAGLGLSILGYAGTHLARGVLLGTGNLRLYGFSLGAEGVVRLAGAAALAGFAVSTAGPYGLVLGAAPLVVALLLLLLLVRAGVPRPRPTGASRIGTGSMLRSLSLLVIASVLSLSLINSGPMAVKLLAQPQEAAQAGQLLAGLALARLPLFAFPTLQAALLPRFARRSDVPDRQRDALVRRVFLLHVAAGIAAAAVCAACGPEILDLAFGAAYALPRLDLAVLAAGATIHLLAMLLGLALVVDGRGRALALSWGVALATAGLVLALLDDLLLRVELGLLAGACAAVVAILVALRAGGPAGTGLRRPGAPALPAAP